LIIFGFALLVKSTSTTPLLPKIEAFIRAVEPNSSVVFISALLASNISTIDLYPPAEAFRKIKFIKFFLKIQ
jgi:hypothetical protein